MGPEGLAKGPVRSPTSPVGSLTGPIGSPTGPVGSLAGPKGPPTGLVPYPRLKNFHLLLGSLLDAFYIAPTLVSMLVGWLSVGCHFMF